MIGSREQLIGLLIRALCRRRNRHVLVTGQRGVGKTMLVRELPRLAPDCEMRLLAGKRFLTVDCGNISPVDSQAEFLAIYASVKARAGERTDHRTGSPDHVDAKVAVRAASLPPATVTQGRHSTLLPNGEGNDFLAPPPIVLCLDGLGNLLRSANVGNNKHLFRRLLNEPRVQVIGILSQWDFDELLASEVEILELCTRVNVPEPNEEAALAIARDAARRLEEEFHVRIEAPAVEKAVALSCKFIWNQCQPAKTLRILERVCEDAEFDRLIVSPSAGRWGAAPGAGNEAPAVGTQPHAEGPPNPPLPLRGTDVLAPEAATPTTIGVEQVIRAIAEISGVPVETLSGDIDDTDYEQILGAAVVGQDEAVGTVAAELRLIKAGITDPGKPASVMLFCGLNGVGKTELAKKLAEIYSASRRLQVYTMANFIESHSVSGIIGVPAGYVGHDQGGRLINDLNADPYGIFLLDEIEKSHPDVLKPFLNLFDEGWIVDQRGVKAYADRAIFIMTSNAGYEAIAQMHQDKRPMHEIADHVKSALARVRNERSSQPVLSQAFLARIKRIVVFNPLAEPAMLGIARLLVQRVAANWKKHRDKSLIVPDDLIAHIAREGHVMNEKSGGREGGRGIRRLIDDLVEDPIQRAAIRSKSNYTRCHTIRLGLQQTSSLDGAPGDSVQSMAPGAQPEVRVSFE
jgi:ATP-dependent Clp protease ATP-binding subunit ClpC